MKIEELFEYELYEGEFCDGDNTDPHCAITGVKDINSLPSNLVLPLKIEDDYYDYYLTEIEAKVFKGAKKLESVVIPGSVKEIGAEAFADCTNLKNITLSAYTEYIYCDAFRGCDAIEEVHIDNIGMLCNVSFANANSNPMTFAKKVFIGDKLLKDSAIIPDKVNSHKVDKIRKFAFSGSKIKRLEFLEGVTNMKIDEEAFCGCDNLSKIIFQDSLESLYPMGLLSLKNLKFNIYNGSKYLGSKNNPYKALVRGAENEECTTLHPNTEIICAGAFCGLDNLKTLYLPRNLKNIMNDAFSGCSNLARAYLAEDTKIFDPSPLLCCKNIEYAEYCGLKYLGSESNRYKAVVGYLTEREAYKLHKDAEMICANAFAENSRLTEMVLPIGVTHINRNAFSQCVNLQKITLAQSLKFVGADAFSGCESLKEIHAPSAEMWCNIEFDCSMVNSSNTNPASRGDLFFGGEKAERVEIPMGVKEIKNYAFDGCKTLKQVILPQSLRSIGFCAFRACPSLEYADIPKSVESIGALAFRNCKSLRSVDLAVKEVPYSAFADCALLESVSFSAGIETIGISAFEGCSSLKRIDICEGVSAIWQEAFRNCSSLIEANLPESVNIISHSAFEGCSSLKTATLPSAVEKLSTCAFQDCSSLESVKIPSTECLERAVFKRCYSLESAVISPGTKYIGMEVFEDCRNLKRVELPEGIERINANSFRDCRFLRSLVLPSSLRIIESGALYASGIEELKIPDGVELWSEAFMRMGALKRIEIPDTVTKIGRDIFRGCDKNLNIVASNKVKELISRNKSNM